MAGYCGYSKSNNAVQAERNNKFPKSKWTKELILKVLSEESKRSLQLDIIRNSGTV